MYRQNIYVSATGQEAVLSLYDFFDKMKYIALDNTMYQLEIWE